MAEGRNAGFTKGKRVMLIHALTESVEPIHKAFRTHWPEAEIYDLLDSSLSADHATGGGVLDAQMIERFRTLGRYAAEAGPGGRATHGILFTCSAFGPAIDIVKQELDIPVLKPNEAAFAGALKAGPTDQPAVDFRAVTSVAFSRTARHGRRREDSPRTGSQGRSRGTGCLEPRKARGTRQPHCSGGGRAAAGGCRDFGPVFHGQGRQSSRLSGESARYHDA